MLMCIYRRHTCTVVGYNHNTHTVSTNFINLLVQHKGAQAGLFGVSLSEPHIDRDNVPRARNNGMSRSIYVPTCMYVCVCRTLAPEIRARPEMLRVIRCIDVLTCVIYNWDSKDDWSYSCLRHSVCREEYRRSQVGECADTCMV